MGITKAQLNYLGFRPIDTGHRTFMRLGSLIFCHPYFDYQGSVPEDYYKVDVREEPTGPDWNKDTGWTTTYQLDELLRVVNTFKYYSAWRQINGYEQLSSWSIPLDSL